MTSTIHIRDKEMKDILKTLSHHVMDENTYTYEERMVLMDLVLQLLQLWKRRIS